MIAGILFCFAIAAVVVVAKALKRMDTKHPEEDEDG